MEIKRINENTVKFYISYVDIEDRGFEREEIWYDRERSEQLFWQMMDEVNYKEDFNVEGPLWIQVQAMDKGLEITVTKAQLSKNGEQLELLSEDEENKSIELPIDDDSEEELLEEKTNEFEKRKSKKDSRRHSKPKENENLTLMVQFNEFEDLIQLSHYFNDDIEGLKTKLYHFKGSYYIYADFSFEMDDVVQENLISQLFEFGEDADFTTHYLNEYGKIIFENDVFSMIKKHFPA